MTKLERYSQCTRRALSFAEIAAKHMQHGEIQTPHVFLGLFQEQYGVAGRLLAELGLTHDFMIQRVQAHLNPSTPYSGNFVLGETTKRTLMLAVDAARTMNHSNIGTGHMLLGIAWQRHPAYSDILAKLEIEPEAFELRIQQAILTNEEPLDGVTSLTVLEERKAVIKPLVRLKNAIASLVGSSQQQDADDTQVENANERLPKFIDNLSNLIEQDKNNIEFLLYRARLYERNRDFDAASGDFAEAIRIAPENKRGYIERGHFSFHREDYDSALQDYTYALELDPQSSEAYIGRAIIHLNREDFESAVSDCNAASRIEPSLTKPYRIRGMAYAELKNYGAAERDFQIYLKQSSRESSAYSNLGWLKMLTEDYEGAIRECNAALHVDRKNGYAYHIRGSAFAKIGKHKDAVADYKQALRYWDHRLMRLKAEVEKEMRDYIEKWEKNS